ncbi:lantibiotic dehydratase [Nonomuraea purpurea]|uniref:Lantibiotic dehydratase n=1 Tax=Nonomuraea purpurea TaxID=1849276 RepID=A0ABV8GBI2_9ACTN
MSPHDWTLLPAVVVRSAGFPWELVLSLVYPRAADAAADVVRLERQALDLLADASVRGAADTGARPVSGPGGRAGSGRLPRGLRSRLRNLRPLPPDAPAPDDWLARWNEVTGLLEEARLTLSGVVAGDAALSRAAMAGIVADERFLDAVVGSSPDLYRDLRRGTKELKLRWRVAAHVQRLGTACRSGPINYGRISPGRDGGYTWSGHHDRTRRVAFPAARVGEALQQRILADPALVARLVPRRRTWSGTAVDVAAFVGACDGSRTLAEIAADSGTGMDRASAALAVAVRRGLLTHDLCPPAGIMDALGWLRERLPAEKSPPRPPGGTAGVASGGPGRGGAGSPGSSGRGVVSSVDVPVQRRRAPAGLRPASGADLPMSRRVGEIADLLERYPAASPDVKLAVQSRIEALAGIGRRDGRCDERVIVHEAAAGTLRVTLGDALKADLEDGVPQVLDLLAEEAELTRLRTNRLLAQRLGAGAFSISEVLRTAGDLRIHYGDRLAGRIAELVRAAPRGTVRLDLAGLLERPCAPAAPVLCSADVMVAARSLEAYEQGVTPLILGDLHDTALLTPWELQFHPDGAALAAGREAAIGRALTGFTALNTISRRGGGLPPPEFPGPVLEFGGVASDSGRRRIGLDELYVVSDGKQALLRATGMDEPLLFHNSEHDTALHTALALPGIRRPDLRELPRTPRLTWGNVVLSRRRWRIGMTSFEALGQAGGDRELLVAMARLRESHDLPETFFASSARRRTPIHVDTRSPALIEGLARLVGTAEGLTLTETLPGPEECWLRDGDQGFAAELRCVYLRRAGESRSAGPRPAPHPYPWPGEGC